MSLLCFAAPKIMCLKMIVQREVESEGVVESFELRTLLIMSHHRNPCTRCLMKKYGTVGYNFAHMERYSNVSQCICSCGYLATNQQNNKEANKQTQKKLVDVFYMRCMNHCKSCNFFHMLERPQPLDVCSWWGSNWLWQPQSLRVRFDFTRFTFTFTEKKASPPLNLSKSGCLIISSPGFLLVSHSLVVESRAQNS